MTCKRSFAILWCVAKSDNAEIVRQLYRQVMSDGRLEDPATADLVPRFYDPDVYVRQMSAIAGTAGAFHRYAGLVESVGEVTREFSNPVFAPEEIKAVGERVAVAVHFRATGRRSGVPVEYRPGHLFTLRNRLVIRFEVFESPADAFRAAESTTSDEPVNGTPGS
jgi:ketosteroid isomerase-like protein